MSETTDSIDNSFAVFMGQIARGRVLGEASDGLRAAVAAVRETGKPASLTVKITLKPLDAEGAQVDVLDEVKTSLPRPRRKMALFFTEDGGELSRVDPKQTELFDEQQPRLVEGGELPRASRLG